MMITFRDLEAIREEHKDKKIVVSGGAFDLLHANHIAYIQLAQSYGDIHFVFVNADERVRRSKGPMRPIVPEADRAAILDAVKGVDYVLIMHGGDREAGESDDVYEEFFKRLKPDIFVTTNDAWVNYKMIFGDTQFVLLPRMAKAGYESTSAIIDHIATTYEKKSS